VNPKFTEWRRINAYRKMKRRAIKQIKNPTEAEALMWQTIQTTVNPFLPEGTYFQRQYVQGPYILDFYCKKARVAVEVDGSIHDSQIEDDRRRDSYMRRNHQIRTLRISNEEVYDFRHREAFSRLILHSCTENNSLF
jgi:very-short-patch-repair endonuclease